MRFSKIGRNFIGLLFQKQRPESQKQIHTFVTSKAVSPTIYTPASGSKLEQLEDLLNDKDYKNSEEVQLVTNGNGGFWCRFVTKKNGFSRNIPNAPLCFRSGK